MRRVLLLCFFALAGCDEIESTAPVSRAEYALAPASLPAFFDCLREQGQAVVAAHRGGPAPGYAENAIPTFEQTLRAAPALLEVDVSQTSDGALVLMHDDTLERTTTGEGPVHGITLADLQALRLVDEEGQTLDARPPTLREALEWATGRAVLELDVKRSVAYEDVVAEVRAAGAGARIVFITYSVGAAIRVHRLAPELMISTTIESMGDLSALERARVDLSRIIAWTGVEEPDSALNVALAARGVEVAFGTLGGGDSWDNRFAESGDQYAEFAETGLQMISTDRAAAAARDLDAADGVNGFGALQCVAAP
jgi:glycerophosphoryl diester phosphodiesterase